MVYFDNAATTYPKPPAVIAAMSRALVRYGANPGRAGHAMSMETAAAVYDAREKCARFFGAEPENTVFMPNCTFALNTAIKGVLPENSHAVTSDIEHNAVLRPLYAMSKSAGVSYSFAVTGTDDETVADFANRINRRTKAVICTLAGNVTGRIMPVRRIGELCRERGICFIVDAA
jgi:selenocysteine lyase/cysteine desulfurase